MIYNLVRKRKLKIPKRANDKVRNFIDQHNTITDTWNEVIKNPIYLRKLKNNPIYAEDRSRWGKVLEYLKRDIRNMLDNPENDIC